MCKPVEKPSLNEILIAIASCASGMVLIIEHPKYILPGFFGRKVRFGDGEVVEYFQDHSPVKIPLSFLPAIVSEYSITEGLVRAMARHLSEQEEIDQYFHQMEMCYPRAA